MVLFLDDYHLGDPLFLSGLAQDLAASGRAAVLLHASRERAADALEADGVLDPEAMLQSASALGDHAAVVERAVRDAGRDIAAALTEAGVAAVRALASDRGLVRASGTPDTLELGDIGWLKAALRQKTTVVIGTLVEAPAGPRLVDSGALAADLGRALDTSVVVLTAARAPGLMADGAVREVIANAALEGRADVPAAAVAQSAAARGARVVVTSRAGLFDPAGARGTRVVAGGESAPARS